MFNEGNLFIELKVAALIKEHGISWAELSRRSGISKKMLSEIKNGQIRRLNYTYERKLAKAFGVTIPELYTEKISW
jgi:transcriptional regulator with XRE-family HTH domain